MARWDFAFFDSGVRFDTPDAQPNSSVIKLTRFVDNPFDGPSISIAKLLAFTPDHLQRMIANNPGGELNTRITATTSALDLVADCATDDRVKLGLRKARVQAKNNFRKELPESVSKVMAMVAAKYGPSSPEVVECVRKGAKFSAVVRTPRWAITCMPSSSPIKLNSVRLLSEATGLKTGWDAIFAASSAATGGKTSTQEGKQMARENLQLMLFLNLLKLAEMFPRQPEKLALYMKQSLLEDHPITSPPADPPPPTPPPPVTP